MSEVDIESNWNRFEEICGKLGDRSEPVLNMLSDIGERLCIAPASSRRSYHNAFPGGLVDHSLRVLDNSIAMLKALKDFYGDIPKESLIISCLFHDLGKLGEPGKDGADYYLPQDSQWHQDKLGEMYKNNPDITFMKHSLRSLMILQHYNIKLTCDEYLAIYLHDGAGEEKNSPYLMKEPKLAVLVAQADLIAATMEKESIG